MTHQFAIFIRLPNWVGDVCMGLPSLQAVINTGLPVVVCARPWARELLSGLSGIQGFVPMTGNVRHDRTALANYRRQHLPGPARGLLLPDSLSSALVFRLAGLPSAGYRDDGRSLLLRWPIRKPAAGLHAVESWYALSCAALQAWGAATPTGTLSPSLHLPTTATQQQQAQDALNQAGLQAGRFVLIAPTATGLHKGRIKVWPGYRALTQVLLSQSIPVAMCPPPNEADQARTAVPEALCLPSLPLGAFATLTRLAAWVICNDSGVSHLAAAAQARQLTLFGVTDPSRTGPWSTQASCLGTSQSWPTTTEVLTHLQPKLPTVR